MAAVICPPDDEDATGLRRVTAVLPTVVLVENGEEQRIRGFLALGASGAVLLDQVGQALVAAIQAARTGQLVVPGSLRSLLGQPRFSKREKQVLAMLVMGFANAEIAGRLYLTESTVKSHLHSAYRKMGVRSRDEAVALILDERLGLGTGILAISGGDQIPSGSFGA